MSPYLISLNLAESRSSSSSSFSETDHLYWNQTDRWKPSWHFHGKYIRHSIISPELITYILTFLSVLFSVKIIIEKMSVNSITFFGFASRMKITFSCNPSCREESRRAKRKVITCLVTEEVIEEFFHKYSKTKESLGGESIWQKLKDKED